ncbi:nucleotidyltransferase family protein [Telmatobacter bradus]|uniref:nucleotidyltransferase family protein n=1 Tax=Telmatobacter bradus TaxID=474953 RepID=UPI003B4382EE
MLAFLHAACLQWHGSGLLLAAEGWSGKTSLAAALVLAGAECDELAAVVTDTWQLRALPSCMSVKPSGHAWMEQLTGQRCIELLERQGYCAEDAEMALYLRKHGVRVRHGSAAIRHYPRLFHPRFLSGVEVHCSLFGEAAAALLPAANVVRDARPVPWRGRFVLVPSLRDQLLHNVLHNTEQAPFVWTAEPQSLRQSVDLTRLATFATEPDWQSAFELLRAHGRW